jgi:hypothetical protein
VYLVQRTNFGRQLRLTAQTALVFLEIGSPYNIILIEVASTLAAGPIRVLTAVAAPVRWQQSVGKIPYPFHQYFFEANYVYMYRGRCS